MRGGRFASAPTTPSSRRRSPSAPRASAAHARLGAARRRRPPADAAAAPSSGRSVVGGAPSGDRVRPRVGVGRAGLRARAARRDERAGAAPDRAPAGRRLRDLAIAGGHAWVTDGAGAEGSLTDVDLAAGRVRRVVPIACCALGVVARGTDVWVSVPRDGPGAVDARRCALGASRRADPVGPGPGPIAFAGGRVWVWNTSAPTSLMAIDPATDRVTAGADLHGVSDIAAGPAGFWAGGDGIGLVQIDPRSGRILRRIGAVAGPQTLAVGDRRRLRRRPLVPATAPASLVTRTAIAAGLASAPVPVGGTRGRPRTRRGRIVVGRLRRRDGHTDPAAVRVRSRSSASRTQPGRSYQGKCPAPREHLDLGRRADRGGRVGGGADRHRARLRHAGRASARSGPRDAQRGRAARRAAIRTSRRRPPPRALIAGNGGALAGSAKYAGQSKRIDSRIVLVTALAGHRLLLEVLHPREVALGRAAHELGIEQRLAAVADAAQRVDDQRRGDPPGVRGEHVQEQVTAPRVTDDRGRAPSPARRARPATSSTCVAMSYGARAVDGARPRCW